MARIAFIALSASLLTFSAPDTASAGWDGYYGTHRSGHWGGSRYVWRYSSCRCRPLPPTMRYAPAQYFDAFYYRSRGGLGRGYWTTVYSTDGYFHRYDH